jgi:hypothetical protein
VDIEKYQQSIIFIYAHQKGVLASQISMPSDTLFFRVTTHSPALFTRLYPYPLYEGETLIVV